MKELIEYIAKSLVSKPDEIKITEEPKEDDRIFKTGFIISNPKLNFKREKNKHYKNDIIRRKKQFNIR